MMEQNSKEVAYTLEGTWHEPGMPGEDPEVRHTISFAGDSVCITIGTQVLNGKFFADEQSTDNNYHVGMVFRVQDSRGEEKLLTGVYWVENNQLLLKFNPELPQSQEFEDFIPIEQTYSGPILMGRAPVTLVLNKVNS